MGRLIVGIAQKCIEERWGRGKLSNRIGFIQRFSRTRVPFPLRKGFFQVDLADL
jgi:hypothetical protein